MAKLLVLVGLLLLISANAVPLSMKALKTQHKSKNLPGPTQDFDQGAQNFKKRTPGAPCAAFSECSDCTETRVCVWIPNNSNCVSSRDPMKHQGQRHCGRYSSETEPDDDDEIDNFSYVDQNPQSSVAIAALGHGQDEFATATTFDQPRGYSVGNADLTEGTAAPRYAYNGLLPDAGMDPNEEQPGTPLTPKA